MSARSLEQALEGIEFPCGRTRLVEYARRNELAPHSLEALEAIPDRQYGGLDELFSALTEPEDVPLYTPMHAALDLWLCAMQTWPEWVQLYQRLWFPWAR